MAIKDIIHIKKTDVKICFEEVYKYTYKNKLVYITKRWNDAPMGVDYWGFLDDDSGDDICVVFD
tara:strand:- start:127 stop:318 length:192 start_codon:yes stop_codon:yes gene_type:complete